FSSPLALTLFPYTTLFRSDPRLRLRAVHEREALLGLQRDRTRHLHVAFPDHRQRQVRERREVTRRADAALRRDRGMNLPVEHIRSEEHTSELQSRSDLVCR